MSPICSHGLPYEMKCRGCFEDAMKSVQLHQHIDVTEEQRNTFFLTKLGQPANTSFPAKQK